MKKLAYWKISRWIAVWLLSGGAGFAQAISGVEPRTEGEARNYNRFPADIPAPIYQRWVEYVQASSPEKQTWLRTLEAQLGGYYFPVYLNRTLFGAGSYDESTDAWAYVKDDPHLPRVLIIGDSISRAYTARVRQGLLGKANVHRAPANCGPTQNFLDNGEIWLSQNGSDRWDFIIVNFGIHDGNRPEGFEERLRHVLARLKQTGAKDIFWVRTTPWGRDASVFADSESDLSRITNRVSDRIAREQGFTILDTHAVMRPLLEAHLSRTDFTHWSEAAYHKLGDFIASSVQPAIEASMPTP